jgi:hypothetical protein
MMIGYAPNTNGYRILMDPKKGTILETAAVTFSEQDVGLEIVWNQGSVITPNTNQLRQSNNILYQ